MKELFKPMLAGKAPEDLSALHYPVMGSVKLDGIRATIHQGAAMSRSMKSLPNRSLQAWARLHAIALNGIDGELIVGEPNVPETYVTTVSALMTEDTEPNFTFYVFDSFLIEGGFDQRHVQAWGQCRDVPRVKRLPHALIENVQELETFESDALDRGYEGVMLRSPHGLYKKGRSSTREGYLLKLKRYQDDEAEVIGVREEMHNGNVAFISELGRTKRSSHKENKTGKGTLGTLVCKGITGVYAGVEFEVGTGFTAVQRAELWEDRDSLVGRIVTYKHFPIGAKDAPRHPVFVRFRDPIDMSPPETTVELLDVCA